MTTTPDTSTKPWGEVRDGDIVTVYVPCKVRIQRNGPSSQASGMRHYWGEVIDHPRTYAFDVGTLVAATIHAHR